MELIDTLNDARERAVSWRTIAMSIRRLEASAPLAPRGQPWIRAVEAICGYSANHLRRMTRAFAATEAMQQHWPDHAVRLANLSFTHAEILGRLWEADAHQVQQLLKADQWPSYAQLLSRYEKSRSQRSAPRAAGKLALGKFRAHVGHHLRYKFGSALRDRVPYHAYVKPDFLVVLPERMVMAWDCVLLPEKIDEEALRRRFVAWATESTFVTEFWIVVQDGRAMDFMRQCVHELDLANVGLMALDDLSPLLDPHGPPTPDRRHSAVDSFAEIPPSQARASKR